MTHAFGELVGHRRTARAVAAGELPDHVHGLLTAGYRPALVAGHDDTTRLRAVYLFTHAGSDHRVELHVLLDRDAPQVPSLADLSFPIGRFEREMRDLFGIVPADHPLPRRLVRHFHWPQGWYPMRVDAGDPPEFGDLDGPYPFRTVEGPGVYEIPVGPVHAGMIEPGHFRFSVVGETILNLKARLWFVHKGLEKLFQGRRPGEGVELAECISGDTAVGHALAYCMAVEDALGIPVPIAARRDRALLLELERLHNHVADIGALCNDVGHGILHAHAGRIRERLLRVNEEVTGHRLLRGAIRPGTTALRAVPDAELLTATALDVVEIVELAVGHSVVRDRFAGTARLTADQAADLGVLGYVARASGLTFDARHDHPFIKPPLPRSEPSHAEGDVLSRFLVRVGEIQESVAWISALLDADDDPEQGETAGAALSGVGIVEGWRGTIVHRVELAGDGTLARVKIVDPSFFNWPALPVALADTIVPDFPLVNKSFNLSYAGNDL
ncbi:NADH-quinone oxidoreductase subunit C [Kutzneria kofuensis]|uniref:Ni,Fe-hydrogenase III large subunit/Ni,Fe-hydrogenase III component G n=1 Tax=Kutzneria kofuensis TaxID=103725 RepID=A0A7W9KQ69_9PSEU|nr:NADH-quinone oxidoreductase subunit C [Kutzneria kofuensis]MBB5896403.1 Ni,Fe-hydrogenase III large subunit/Ni,Fe-hydrogenase III component G [Kutzneria kofuensis]